MSNNAMSAEEIMLWDRIVLAMLSRPSVCSGSYIEKVRYGDAVSTADMVIYERRKRRAQSNHPYREQEP